MNRRLSLLVLLTVWAAATVGHGQEEPAPQEGVQEEPAPQEGARVLLVLRVGANAPQLRREGRFVQELRLALDQVVVRYGPPPDERFATFVLEEQVAVVRRLVRRHGAVACTWLGNRGENGPALHMVVVSRGRALVRLVESSSETDSEVELALSAKELLDAAFLFDPPAVQSAPVERADGAEAPAPAAATGAAETDPPAVQQRQAEGRPAQRPEVALRPPSPSVRPPGRWFLGVAGRGEGGVAGEPGHLFYAGAEAHVERRLYEGLGLRLGFGFGRGPWGSFYNDEDLTEWLLWPQLGLSYLWSLGSWRLGPVLAGQVLVSRLRGRIVPAEPTDIQVVRFRLSVGVEVHRLVLPFMALTLGAGLVYRPITDRYTARNSETATMETAYLSWQLSLGLVWQLDRPSSPSD